MFCKSAFVPWVSISDWAGVCSQNTVESMAYRDFKSLASTSSATSARVAFQGFGRKRQPMFCKLSFAFCKTAFAPCSWREEMSETAAAERLDLDPAWHLMPREQVDRVLGQDQCDIAPEFLGFTGVYLSLATIIPTHWTVVDLGCAYAPQAFIFRDHAAYIGVDISDGERFCAPNTTHYVMPIANFIEEHGASFDQARTFAICSYVPSWHQSDNMRLARESFQNVFTYYPARDKTRPMFLSRFES